MSVFQRGQPPHIFHGIKNDLSDIAESFKTLRLKILQDGTAQLYDDEDDDIALRRINIEAYAQKLEVKVGKLEEQKNVLEETVNTTQETARSYWEESAEWKSKFEEEKWKREDAEATLERTEKLATELQQNLLRALEKIDALERHTAVHDERLEKYLGNLERHTRMAPIFYKIWNELKWERTMELLSKERQEMLDEMERSKATIRELKGLLAAERKETVRLRGRAKDQALIRLTAAGAWANPTKHRRFLGMVFEAWRYGRWFIYEALQSFLNSVSLRWHIKQLAHVEQLIKKLNIDIETVTMDASQAYDERDGIRRKSHVRRFRDTVNFKTTLHRQEREMLEKFEIEREVLEKRIKELEITHREEELDYGKVFKVVSPDDGMRCLDCSTQMLFTIDRDTTTTERLIHESLLRHHYLVMRCKEDEHEEAFRAINEGKKRKKFRGLKIEPKKED